MSAPIQKYLAQAVGDFEIRLKTQMPKIKAQTVSDRLRGAKDFALFLTGTELKRDQRTKPLM